MYRVYFYDVYTEPKEKDIAFVKTLDEASRIMSQYVKEQMPDYRVYYWRYWGDEKEGYTYDFGKYTQFFKVDYVEVEDGDN